MIMNTLKIAWDEKRSAGIISKLIEITDENISAQGRLLIADEALSAGLIGEANDQLNKISENEYDSYYYHLQSKIAEINDDKASSSKALELAFNAPRKHNWNCNSCGTSAAIWQINCQGCEQVGSLNWQAPPEIIKVNN